MRETRNFTDWTYSEYIWGWLYEDPDFVGKVQSEDDKKTIHQKMQSFLGKLNLLFRDEDFAKIPNFPREVRVLIKKQSLPANCLKSQKAGSSGEQTSLRNFVSNFNQFHNKQSFNSSESKFEFMCSIGLPWIAALGSKGEI